MTRLEKCATGISGLDDVTSGGLPRERASLVCGGAGCGKTLLCMSFLVRGALDFGEPGVFISFEETPEDLAANMFSLGIDLDELQENDLLSMDHIRIDRSEILESGEYDLEGLFLRLNLAIEAVGAKRVVIDTLESSFGGLSDSSPREPTLQFCFSRKLPDVLVSDVAMPERDGDDLIREVRARGLRCETLPAIAVSAFARTEDRRLALTAGYQAHVAKPVDGREQLARAAELLSRPSPQSG